MSKGTQYFTPYQRGIVNRFFQHRDTALLQRLAEVVSELYLAEGEKKKAKLWVSALDTLTKAGCDPKDIIELDKARDVTLLAGIVNELQSKPAARSARPAPKPADDDL
jgi:hypothetical protein